MFGTSSKRNARPHRALVLLGFGLVLANLSGCQPSDGIEQGQARARLIASPVLSLEEIANDPRVESFVAKFIQDQSASVREYRIRDKYLTTAPHACRYEVEVATTVGATYYLTVDLLPDGSLSIPLGRLAERGSTDSRRIDTSRAVAGPLASPASEASGSAVIRATERTPMTAGGTSSAAASISTDGHEPRSSSGSTSGSRLEVRVADPRSADPRSSPARKATPPASASDRSDVKADDPNLAKIEAYVEGWLSSEHQDEVETFVVRGRESTTFKADRYYVWITTLGEHSYNLTVDMYHDGRKRVFKSQKLY